VSPIERGFEKPPRSERPHNRGGGGRKDFAVENIAIGDTEQKRRSLNQTSQRDPLDGMLHQHNRRGREFKWKKSRHIRL